MHKDPHIEIHRAGEKRNDVAFVAVGMGLKTGENDTHALEWRRRGEDGRGCEGEKGRGEGEGGGGE